ncbi:hypothetical protein BRC19_01575 [Candidatus Saccharibacteria bacterium QS_5_54_17]|nr:MAG: hypothetical protein BRC19_01575 [Candidatus Saccharibacteria bacterium QS_5_54_17]
MERINFNSGIVRAVITFIIVSLTLMLLFWLLERALNINFFAQTLLVLIGGGWSAYYIWKKTEMGYYK